MANKIIKITFLVLLLLASPTAKAAPLDEIKQNLQTQEEAKQRFTELYLVLEQQSFYSPSTYKNKQVSFQYLLPEYENGTYRFEMLSKSGPTIICNVSSPEIKATSDINLVEVTGTVIGIKPESLEININAESINIMAAQ